MSLFQIDTGQEWGPHQQRALFLARELSKKRYAFHLAVRAGSPLHEKAAGENLPALALNIRGGKDLRTYLRLGRAMRRRRCVLAHYHDAHALAVGSRAASFAHVPLQVLSRSADFPAQPPQKYTKSIDAIIAESEGIKSLLVRGGIAEGIVEVIPPGIDFSPFAVMESRDHLRREFAFAPDDYIVGIVASLEDESSRRKLAKAAQIVREQTPKIRFIVVGEGALRMEASWNSRETSEEAIVYYLGFRDDLPRILSSLDVFVMFSQIEGPRTYLMNAMAARIPVVSAKVSGIPDWVIHQDTGLFVSAKDPRSLAAAVLKLHKDSGLSDQLAQRGCDIVHEMFSAEAMARRIIDLYEKLAFKKGTRLA